MITLEEYLRAPCGSLSVPLWKWRRMSLPENMLIRHDREFAPQPGYEEQRFFRLRHDLKQIPKADLGNFAIRTAETADIPGIVEIINRSYADIRVTEEQICALTETPVYDGTLWVLALERKSGAFAGCALADLDREAGEGILEWVQVLPQYRRRGVGRLMVAELLRRMAGKADFATVSGRCDDASNPERLYRSCGFAGNDIWHIMRKNNSRKV